MSIFFYCCYSGKEAGEQTFSKLLDIHKILRVISGLAAACNDSDLAVKSVAVAEVCTHR